MGCLHPAVLDFLDDPGCLQLVGVSLLLLGCLFCCLSGVPPNIVVKMGVHAIKAFIDYPMEMILPNETSDPYHRYFKDKVAADSAQIDAEVSIKLSPF